MSQKAPEVFLNGRPFPIRETKDDIAAVLAVAINGPQISIIRDWNARVDALDELLNAEDAAAIEQPDQKGNPK